MAPTRPAHFESNRTPEAATAAVAAAYDFSYSFYYYYACQAMLEVRSSGE